MARPPVLDEVDQAEVVARYKAGSSLRKIGRHFDIGAATVLRVLELHDVPRRGKNAGHRQKYDNVDTAEIVRLRDEGRSWGAIAVRTGMKPSGVRRRYASACRSQTGE